MKYLSHACLLFAFTFFHHSFFAQVTTVALDVSTTVGDAEIRIGNGNVYNGNGVSANVSVPFKKISYRFLMHFNYSAIPSNAVITSAILRLTPTTAGEGTVTISSFIANAITSNWHESTVTAANGTSVISANQQTVSTFVGGKREFDLKNMIQAAVNGTQPITGISIRRNPETFITNACQYHTKEATDITKRPKLTISYYIPFNITSANINKASTLTSSNGSIAPTITGGSGSTTYQWINSSGQQIATTQNLTTVPYGWYGLKLTGTLGDVYYMSFLIGVTCEPVTINFPKYPGNLPNNPPNYMSNYIDDANLATNVIPATTNFGTATNVLMGSNAVSNRTSLLRFRVWMDNANEYADAKLYLFGNAHSTGANAAVINRVTSNWNELSVNNTNAPTFSTDLTVPLPTTATITENKILSVTEYFRYWTINPTQHFGFRFSGPASGTQNYHSSDATNASLRPYVSIVLDDRNCDRTSFVAFKSKQDGSLISTYKGMLKVSFIEEYQQSAGKKWPLKLYNSDKVMIAAINYDGTSLNGLPLLPAVNYVFSDNRTVLNLSNLNLITNAIYMLELTKSTGEIEYIEFIYKP